MVQEVESRILSSMILRQPEIDSYGTSDYNSLPPELLNGVDVHDRLFDLEMAAGAIYAVKLTKSSEGFGFNIVGGTDNQHLPGHDGIFVSMVKKRGPAGSDGRIREGDRIISLNCKELLGLSHDEAVSAFRSVAIGESASFIIEAKGDLLISKEPYIHPILPKSSDHNVLADSETAAVNEDKSDSESVTSYAPSQHSIIDDVPRTPKKPLSILDPRNNSIFTEVLYVSIGLAVITGACLIGYKMYNRGRS